MDRRIVEPLARAGRQLRSPLYFDIDFLFLLRWLELLAQRLLEVIVDFLGRLRLFVDKWRQIADESDLLDEAVGDLGLRGFGKDWLGFFGFGLRKGMFLEGVKGVSLAGLGEIDDEGSKLRMIHLSY